MGLQIQAYSGQRACSILQQNRRGELYSVHRSSFYCMMHREMILVHDSVCGTIPFGISVERLRPLLPQKGLRPRMTVSYQNPILKIAEGELSLYLQEIKSEKAVLKKPRSAAAITFNADYLLQRLCAAESGTGGSGLPRFLRGFFDKKGQDDCPEHRLSPFQEKACGHLAGLVEAILQQNHLLMKKSLDHLIGLGTGLTPSMDDLLVGLLATAHYCKRNLGHGVPVLPVLAEYILASAGKTNRISEAYLHSAARGEIFAVVEDLLTAALTLPRRALESPLNRLLAVGSSSGKEILLGIVVGLKLFLPEKVGEVKNHL